MELSPLARSDQLEPETIAMLHENPEASLADALGFNADIVARKLGIDLEKVIKELDAKA